MGKKKRRSVLLYKLKNVVADQPIAKFRKKHTKLHNLPAENKNVLTKMFNTGQQIVLVLKYYNNISPELLQYQYVLY